MDKNKKISASLKRHYRTKRRNKEIKTIFWLIALIALIGIYTEHNILKPVQAEAPYARQNNTFPVAEDKKNLTDKERMFISAFKECKKRDLGDYCINDIMGMANKETKFKCDTVGDFGASYGCLQIHLGFHPEISQKEARDPKFAVKWTLDRMEHYGYPEYRSYAIMKHNGTPNTPRTLAYLNSVNNY